MIKRIQYNNHDILGNLELDFQKENGEPYGTVIFAGDNGVGKTTILDTLAVFLNLGSFEPFTLIEYEIDECEYCIFPSEYDGYQPNFGFHSRKENNNGTVETIRTNRNNNRERLNADIKDIRYYGVSYSKARSGFPTKLVKSSGTEQLDDNKYMADSEDDFTKIKQLLIDVDSQDSSDWKEKSINNPGMTYEEYRPTSKMFRFENAFNTFFEGMKFYKIDHSSAREIQVLFKKNDKTISIDSLSTGEKQIVFRGTSLLRNSQGIKNGIVLVDEPELSMHPRWQKKVLQYYRGLFEVDGQQTVQMLFATHSEYVIEEALRDRGNILVIVLKGQDHSIQVHRITAPNILPRITTAETNYLAFGIYTNDYHIELYNYLQTVIDKETIKDCDDFIISSDVYDELKHHKTYEYQRKSGKKTVYESLPTYIRNCIDHPSEEYAFSEEELKESIELLRAIIKQNRG